MSVIGTWCQICGAPVQHDHCVEADGMFEIYRGDGQDECKPAVNFGNEHRWLRDAVGLCLNAGQTPATIEGLVHDGTFEAADGSRIADGMVWDGLDDRAALHKACWELAAKPESWSALESLVYPQDFTSYYGQLFEFAALIRDGKGWMLADPTEASNDGRKNRERILAVLKSQKLR